MGDCRAKKKKILYLLFPFLKSHWPFSITLVTARGDVILHCLHPILLLREDALPLRIQISFRSCSPQELNSTTFCVCLFFSGRGERFRCLQYLKMPFHAVCQNYSKDSPSLTQITSIGPEGS